MSSQWFVKWLGGYLRITIEFLWLKAFTCGIVEQGMVFANFKWSWSKKGKACPISNYLTTSEQTKRQERKSKVVIMLFGCLLVVLYTLSKPYNHNVYLAWLIPMLFLHSTMCVFNGIHRFSLQSFIIEYIMIQSKENVIPCISL